MKIVYSLITEDDIDGIYNISKDSFSIPWSLNSIKSEVSNPLAKYVVARDIDSNIVIGFIGIWIVAGEGDITNIAVDKGYRGLGIGKKLLEYLINLCTDLKCNIIHLEVRESNLKAQNLYKSFNFNVDGIRKNYYEDNKENAILMSKDLQLATSD
ncbi:ribosomal protein S18-alanine N-acetyltransferase [Clostridium tertium]|uniref:[Ribosomal protein bS18]-alanine N-acetyltransferase n=1 Tax=Clostridium tertium TaxID=1559 RepID=A0A6N3D3K5_9CLOT